MKDYYKSALAETGLILLFTFMPTLFVLGKILISNDIINHAILYKSGEFYLYSVSLMGSAFLVYNHYKVKKSDENSILSFVCLFLLVIFSLAYTIIANTTNPKLNFVKWSSIVSILISAIIFFYSQVVNNRESPDVAQQRREEQQIIENGLN